jgi:hypothetical protein
MASSFLLNNLFIERRSGATNGLHFYITQQDSADDESAYSGAVSVAVLYQDWKPITQLTPNRVDDAQAGYKVIGYAPSSVVQKEFDNYEYFIPFSGSPGYVLFRGILKVSKTDVFTPQFLSYDNVQFQF